MNEPCPYGQSGCPGGAACACALPPPSSKTVTLADEIVAMAKDMDLRYDRNIEESMLLDIVLKARILQRLEQSGAVETSAEQRIVQAARAFVSAIATDEQMAAVSVEAAEEWYALVRACGVSAVVCGASDRVVVGEPLAAAGYVTSGPHLSGYRVSLGFDTLEKANAAHQRIVDLQRGAAETSAKRIDEHSLRYVADNIRAQAENIPQGQAFKGGSLDGCSVYNAMLYGARLVEAYIGAAAPVTDEAPAECTRSHPHEEMSAECQRLTEVARARRTADYWKAEHLAGNKEIERLNALLERATKWIGSTPHGDDCYVSNNYEGDPGNHCRCGKEAMLEVLESPEKTGEKS